MLNFAYNFGAHCLHTAPPWRHDRASLVHFPCGGGSGEGRRGLACKLLTVKTGDCSMQDPPSTKNKDIA